MPRIMSPTALNQIRKPYPLALDLATLGRSIRLKRLECGLDLQDAADIINIDGAALKSLEDGKPVDTFCLFKVLEGLGLTMLVMPPADAENALDFLGQTVNWGQLTEANSSPRNRQARGPVSMPLDPEKLTPTLFVDFDGTLHVGTAYIDDRGDITLDSGRPLLEFAPLLEELLVGYPKIEIVLTTSWLTKMPVQKVIDALPAALRRRVVGTTGDVKPRWSYLLAGTERTDVIIRYAAGKRLRNWLAIDDAVFGIERAGFGAPGELVEHFVLLDPAIGINDRDVLSRIAKWLADVHAKILEDMP
ncbi:HAD domain-containing protein [Paraburkholderia sp. BR10936]|uniref:HAD domain-containing protein n=1 Tax=Paraburkholderia sp. BR10936 TaxID=3236993 RepID=UPI0034D2C701